MPLPRVITQAAYLNRDEPWLIAGYLSDAGYDVQIVESDDAVNFDPVSKRVGLVDEASVPIAVGPDGTRYIAALRARTAAGHVSSAAETLIPLVALDGALIQRPASPLIVAAAPSADGNVTVRWTHADGAEAAPAAGFYVYGDGGSGSVDWVTPLATVNPLRRSAVLSGLATGVRHLIGVRAYAVGGTTDANRRTRAVVPRDDPPGGLGAGNLSLEQS